MFSGDPSFSFKFMFISFFYYFSYCSYFKLLKFVFFFFYTFYTYTCYIRAFFYIYLLVIFARFFIRAFCGASNIYSNRAEGFLGTFLLLLTLIFIFYAYISYSRIFYSYTS